MKYRVTEYQGTGCTRGSYGDAIGLVYISVAQKDYFLVDSTYGLLGPYTLSAETFADLSLTDEEVEIEYSPEEGRYLMAKRKP